MADQTEQEPMLSIIQNRVERASQGKWTACRMTHAERGGDLTPEELGEYVMNSVRKSAEASGSSTFLFISVEKADGQPADVCHVGNGPTSPQNADFIQHAPDDVRYLLALLRERDAQIARKETALNMWRGWAHFVYLKGGPITLDDEALRAAVCVVHDDETATLRAERDDARAACMEWDRLHKRAIAERDAAQQQIATLTEALKELREDIESGAWAERNDASKWAERDLIWFISAALQSTRPQEQPAEPDYIDIEPDIRVVRVYRDGSWLEDLKAGGRRRASFPPATHQQGGHQP